jgi:hypothetical protein
MKSCGIIGALILCFALVACAKPTPPDATATQQPTPVQAEIAPPPPPRPPRKPPVPQTPLEVAKVEPVDIPPPTPEQLIGLNQPETQALLGDPDQRAEAAPATIWRYTGRNCEIEIYFYLDLKSQVMRALHYEVRSHDPPEPARNRCFADLIAEHKGDPDHPASADPPR